jgi:hypothetical protein
MRPLPLPSRLLGKLEIEIAETWVRPRGQTLAWLLPYACQSLSFATELRAAPRLASANATLPWSGRDYRYSTLIANQGLRTGLRHLHDQSDGENSRRRCAG